MHGEMVDIICDKGFKRRVMHELYLDWFLLLCLLLFIYVISKYIFCRLILKKAWTFFVKYDLIYTVNIFVFLYTYSHYT